MRRYHRQALVPQLLRQCARDSTDGYVLVTDEHRLEDLEDVGGFWAWVPGIVRQVLPEHLQRRGGPEVLDNDLLENGRQFVALEHLEKQSAVLGGDSRGPAPAHRTFASVRNVGHVQHATSPRCPPTESAGDPLPLAPTIVVASCSK